MATSGAPPGPGPVWLAFSIFGTVVPSLVVLVNYLTTSLLENESTTFMRRRRDRGPGIEENSLKNYVNSIIHYLITSNYTSSVFSLTADLIIIRFSII